MKSKKSIIGIVLGAVVLIGVIIGAVVYSTANRSGSNTADRQGLTEQESETLKNKVGKGTAGDVTKVEETDKGDDSRIYTYYFKGGGTQKIAVHPGSGEENPDPAPQGQKDPEKQPVNPKEYGTAFEEYAAMTPRQQYDFYHSFKDPAEFYSWYHSAQSEYLDLHKAIVVNPGDVIEFCEE